MFQSWHTGLRGIMLAKFDRYMLSQLLLIFGFFALILVAVLWVNRGVQLFDRLIGDGQTAVVFFEFTALGLPRLITTVVPIATFGAAVYVTYRLNNESELTVMEATGSSPWRLACPVAVFGLITALMISALAHVLVPASKAQLSVRSAEISRNIAARLLSDGTFLTPTQAVTFYTREITVGGVLLDVFLADRRDHNARFVYTAAEAYLIQEEEKTFLIMVDGLAQRLSSDDRLSTVKFEDFSFDITNVMRSSDSPAPTVDELGSQHLIGKRAAIVADFDATPGEVAEELHSRFARATFCFVTALVGFAALMIGGYSRYGVWREVIFAFILLLVLDGARGILSELVISDAKLWPILYLPSLIGGMLVVGLLTHASHPGMLNLRRSATA